uniref:Uncharacterized protein n=1 Tax=Utricularia reniformis TaxID=192314 RepID=A0A1Y0B1Y6_9LAMI|nr:hypothetical protein AEK19_MT1246 [Utricularia reniformis]ART31456.1 hypothetical protein AEK19_MT1246 [Utricularia reniformis]
MILVNSINSLCQEMENLHNSEPRFNISTSSERERFEE